MSIIGTQQEKSFGRVHQTEIRNKFKKSRMSSKVEVPETKGQQRVFFYRHITT
jgi:hypothetical protein